MAILYLQWSTQAFGTGIPFDTAIRDSVLRAVEALAVRANWPATQGRRVRHLPDTSDGKIGTPHPTFTASDCIVYIVSSYNSGAAQAMSTLLNLSFPAHSPQAILIRQARDPLSLAELGVTIPSGSGANDPTASEVHVSKCIRFLMPVSTSYAGVVPSRQDELIRTIATTVLHEAMHNKVEPQMGANWDLHTSGGGVAGPITCTPYGIRACRYGPIPFNQIDQQLLQQHFASQHRQFVWT